jgi:tetratricopeptide (TPR) repeat protein
LKGIEKFPKSRAGYLSQMVYYSNYVMYYLELGDVDAAEEMLAQFDKTLQNPKLRIKVIEMYSGLYRRRELEVQMAKGNYDECEEYFEQAYADADGKLRRVFTKYHLGMVYLYEEREDDAVDAFLYVVENGGSSVYTKKAIEQLKALEVSVDSLLELVQSESIESNQIDPKRIFASAERAALLVSGGILACVLIAAMIVFSG